MTADDVRFDQCPDCGALKPEGGLCRRCESEAVGVPSVTWAATLPKAQARPRNAVPNWIWAVAAVVVVVAGVAVGVGLSRRGPDYGASFDRVSGAMIAASAELGAYLDRGGGWSEGQVASIRSASDRLNAAAEQAIRLKASPTIITAHSLLTGAAVTYQKGCGQILACLAAHEAGAPTDVLAQAARSTLSAADQQMGEAHRALTQEPIDGT